MGEKTTNRLVVAFLVIFGLCLVGMAVAMVGFIYTSETLVTVGEVLTAPLTVVLGLLVAGVVISVACSPLFWVCERLWPRRELTGYFSFSKPQAPSMDAPACQADPEEPVRICPRPIGQNAVSVEGAEVEAMKRRLEELLAQAVPMSTLQVVGKYTFPHTWGVYRIEPAKASSTKRFRKGNHPVRQRELTRDYPDGPVKVIALYTVEALAIELMELLNENSGAAAAAGL